MRADPLLLHDDLPPLHDTAKSPPAQVRDYKAAAGKRIFLSDHCLVLVALVELVVEEL